MKQKFVDYYAKIARDTAELSYAVRRKVGCIAVKDGNILAIGYNGTPAGWDNKCEDEIKWPNGEVKFTTTKPEVLHAEANAIGKLARSLESGDGATMYITHAPCFECSKLIIQAGISEVRYCEEYRDDSGVKLLEKAGIPVYQDIVWNNE